MKKLFIILALLPYISKAQPFVKQGVCTQSGNYFTLNGISQSPYAGRFFSTTAVNLNSNFDLTFSAYLGNTFNNGMAFLFVPGAMPTATTPALVINTDNIHNFGTGSIATDFVVEFDIRGSFCVAGQNTSYEPVSDVNHVSYWKNNSSCTFGNYFSPYTALGTINYYAYEPYRIKWTKATNTLETYYNNVLLKSNVVDLVGILGANVYWGFSAGCYCVTGGPSINLQTLNGLNVIPLDLTDFSAEKNNSLVKLNWTTAQEQNTSHFLVEKSSDGTNFSYLQTITAAGNSSTIKKYSATDPSPLYGTNFYRLKMVDIDGKYTYSKTVAIRMHDKANGVTIFPNPVGIDLQVQIPWTGNGAAVIEVTDMAGKLIQKENIKLGSSLVSTSINVGRLKPGVYLLTVINGEERESRKFIKQ